MEGKLTSEATPIYRRRFNEHKNDLLKHHHSQGKPEYPADASLHTSSMLIERQRIVTALTQCSGACRPSPFQWIRPASVRRSSSPSIKYSEPNQLAYRPHIAPPTDRSCQDSGGIQSPRTSRKGSNGTVILCSREEASSKSHTPAYTICSPWDKGYCQSWRGS